MPALADVERVFREEYGRAVAVLTRVFGDDLWRVAQLQRL